MRFWNSKYAYPIASGGRAGERRNRPSPTLPDSGDGLNAGWMEGELNSGRIPLAWVPANRARGSARPRIASETSPGEEDTIANNPRRADAPPAKQELIVISPYFVPGKDGVALLAKLVDQGVHIRILTKLTGVDRFAPGAQRIFALPRGAAQARDRAVGGAAQARTKARPAFHPFRGFRRQSCHAKALVIDQKNRVHRIHEHGRTPRRAPTANSDS